MLEVVFLSKNILIIDNDESFYQSAQFLLGSLPVILNWAKTGAKGQTMAGELSPDLIILCVELPDTSGYMLCKKLRASQVGKQARIIITSAKAKTSDFDNHRKKFDYRADSYLKKPIQEEELLESVSILLGTDEDFKGFQKPVEDVQLNDWVNGQPEIESKDSGDSDDDGHHRASLKELQELVKSQERELEYLRKETSAFQSFMSQAQKTENALKETRTQLRVREKLLAEMKEHENADPHELLSRITELEHAAEKREKALDEEISERRKADREVARLKRESAESRQELDNSESTLNQLKLEVKNFKLQNDAQSVEEEADKNHIRKIQEQVQALQNKISETEGLLNQRETELDSERSAHEDAKEGLNRATRNFNEERDRVQMAKKNLKEANSNLERIRDERDRLRLENEQGQQQLTNQRAQLQDRDDQIKDKQDRILKLEVQQDAAIQEHRRQISEKEQELENCSRKLEREKHQRADLEASIQAKNNELEGLLTRAKQLEDERNQLQQQLHNTLEVKDDEIKNLNRQLAETRGSLQSLENTHRDAENELKSLRKENQESHGRITSMDSDLQKHRQGMEQIKHELDVERKEHHAQRERFKEVEAQLKADENHFQSQKAELNLKVDALNTLLKQTKTDHDIAISILNQEKASIQETWQGEKSQLKETLKDLESQRHEQQDTIQTLERKIQGQEQQFRETLEKTVKENQAALTQLRQESDIEKTRLEEDHTRQLTTKEKRIENLEEDKSHLQADLSRLEVKFNELAKTSRQSQEKANERIAELEHDYEKSGRAIQKEREAKEEAAGKLASLNTHLENLTRDQEKAIQDLRKQHQQQIEDEKHLLATSRDQLGKVEAELNHFRQFEDKYEAIQKEFEAHRMVSQTWKNRLHLTRQHLETALSELIDSEDELNLEED